MSQPILNRYRVDSFLCPGSLGSSNVWRGTDLETGAAVVLKIYEPHMRVLFIGEVQVGREVFCSQLAPMLGVDEERMIIVKPYLDGQTLKSGAKPPTENGRRHLRDAISILAAGDRAGRDTSHAMQTNNLILVDGRIVSCEACNSPLGGFRSSELHGSQTLGLAFRFLGGMTSADARALADAVARAFALGESPEAAVRAARLHALRERDGAVAEIVERDEDDPIALESALERLCWVAY